MSSYSVQAILSAKDDGFTSTFQKALGTVSGFEKSLKGGLGFGFVTGMGQAAFNLIGKGFSAITASMDSAISRVDTLNQFPKVLSLMGVESSSASKAMSILSDGIDGLPTALDEIASTAQSLTVLTGDAEKSAHAAVALNDAFLMSGSSSAEASRAMTQYSQMLAKGKVDQQSWNSLLETMGPALQKVAEGFGYTGSAARTQLYDALKSGKITFDQFQDKLIELDQACEVAGEGFDGFAAVAKQSTKGIATSMKNVRTAVTKNLANMINRADKIWQNMGSGIADHFDTMKANVNKAFSGVLNSKMFSHAMRDLGKFINSVEAGMTSMAANIGPALDAAYPYFKKFKGRINQVKGAFGDAFDAINEAVGPDFLSNLKTDSLNMLTSAADSACASLKQLASFIQDNAATIGKFLPHLPKLAAGFIGLKAAGMFMPYAEQFMSGAQLISGGVSSLSGVLSKGVDGLGKLTSYASGKASKGLGVLGKASKSAGGLVKKHLGGLGKIAKNSMFAEDIHRMGISMKGFGKITEASAKTGTKAMGLMFNGLGATVQAGLAALGPAVLVGALFAGMGVLYNAFGGQIDQLTNMAITKGPGIISGLASGIASQIPALIQSGAQMLAGFMNVITANFPALVSAGLQIVGSLVTGLISSLPTLIPAALNMVTTIITTLVSAIPQVIIMGMMVILGLVQGLVSNIGLVISSGVQIINSIVNAIVTGLPIIIMIGLSILSNLASGMAQALPVLIVAALNGITAIVQTIFSMLPAIAQTGVQIVMNLVQGVLSNLPALLSAGVNLIVTIVSGILNALPTIISCGAQIIGQLLMGLIQAMPAVTQAGWDLITGLANAIKEAIPALLTSALEGVENIFTNLGEGISSVWDQIKGKTSESTESVASSVETMGERVDSSATQAAESMQNSANTGSTAMETYAGIIAETSGGMVDFSNQGSAALWDLSANSGQAFSMMNTDMMAWATGAGQSASAYGDELASAGAQAEKFAEKHNTSLQSTERTAQTSYSNMGQNTQAFLQYMQEMATMAGTQMPDGFTDMYSAIGSGSDTSLNSIMSLCNGGGEGFTSLQGQAQSSTETVAAAMENLMGSFDTASGSMETFGGSFDTISASMESFGGSFETINASMESLGTSLGASTEQISSVATSAASSFTTLESACTVAFSTMHSTAASSMSAMSSSVSDNMSQITSTAQSSMSSMRSTVTSGANGAAQAMTSGMSRLVAAISSASSRAISITTSMVSSIISAMQSGAAGAYSAGVMIGQGLGNGLAAMVGYVQSQAAALAAAANAAIAAKAAIGSPSKITTKYGRWYGEGFGNGMRDRLRYVRTAAADLVTIPQMASGPSAYVGAYSAGLSLDEEAVYGRAGRYVIEVPVSIDGREFAKATAEYTQDELDRRNRRSSRKKGVA